MTSPQKQSEKRSMLRRLCEHVGLIKVTNVYFISGMCYNCSVFDRLALPKRFRKVYIEWYIPRDGETLSHYARTMAKEIDSGKPFILVGYSFGAVIMQEINRFLNPQKSIIISSFKSPEEIPVLFSAVKRTHILNRLPGKLFASTEFVTSAFNRLVYNTTNAEVEHFMTVTHPDYIRWAVEQITSWVPDIKCDRIYHIHGTDDQIFPFKQISNVFPIEGGDHLMVYKKASAVSSILDSILLMK